MRFIDTLKFHKPTGIERTTYKIASATERINMHHLSDVLVICGARSGGRFRGGRINQLQALVAELTSAYADVNTCFQRLPLAACQFKFENHLSNGMLCKKFLVLKFAVCRGLFCRGDQGN